MRKNRYSSLQWALLCDYEKLTPKIDVQFFFQIDFGTILANAKQAHYIYILVLTLLFSYIYHWPIERRYILIENLTLLNPILDEKFRKPFETYFLQL